MPLLADPNEERARVAPRGASQLGRESVLGTIPDSRAGGATNCAPKTQGGSHAPHAVRSTFCEISWDSVANARWSHIASMPLDQTRSWTATDPASEHPMYLSSWPVSARHSLRALASSSGRTQVNSSKTRTDPATRLSWSAVSTDRVL
jgi:hypothetical protein